MVGLYLICYKKDKIKGLLNNNLLKLSYIYCKDLMLFILLAIIIEMLKYKMYCLVKIEIINYVILDPVLNKFLTLRLLVKAIIILLSKIFKE